MGVQNEKQSKVDLTQWHHGCSTGLNAGRDMEP